MTFPRIYFLTVYFIWEFMIDIDTTPAVYLTIILWVVFFLATRDYSNVVRALKSWPESVGK